MHIYKKGTRQYGVEEATAAKLRYACTRNTSLYVRLLEAVEKVLQSGGRMSVTGLARMMKPRAHPSQVYEIVAVHPRLRRVIVDYQKMMCGQHEWLVWDRVKRRQYRRGVQNLLSEKRTPTVLSLSEILNEDPCVVERFFQCRPGLVKELGINIDL